MLRTAVQPLFVLLPMDEKPTSTSSGNFDVEDMASDVLVKQETRVMIEIVPVPGDDIETVK